ncbi:phosphoglycerol transferase [Campylobacter hyointestinalis subsp. hyointestinalis]|uniref:sulfatase-like hydrolase/transferase n=1 Tax=Campylobacter hyointestinalis TaxID=198 RepID=UPI0010FF76F6|nr:sulfatase-like hydrolase/transferase [Campylobacter hyointestinalis]QCU00662.1 phosphoglycerol transferase [Campylobacter hyointestinalis subsp. hyointestinalis]
MKYVSYVLTFAFFVFAMVLIARFKVTPVAIIFTALQFGILFLAMFALSGQWLRSVNFASTLLVCVYYISNLTYHYYKKPLFSSDFLLFFDTENWGIILEYKELIFIILLYILVLLFGIFAYRDTKRVSIKFRIISIFGLVCLIFSNCVLIRQKFIMENWLKTFPEAKEINMNLAMSLVNMSYQAPYFDDSYPYFEDKMSRVRPYKVSNLKPNLVLFLQESTVDVTYYKGDLKQVDMFKGDDFKFKSLARVHTFGGGTFKSEFEILTGLSVNDFGVNSSTVFYNVTEHLSHSLPKMLKEHGYYVISLNPLVPKYFNVYNAYKDLGVDKYFHPYDLECGKEFKNGDSYKNLWKISSKKLGECVKEIYNKYKDKEPLFIYATTIDEHVPYDRASKVEYGLDKFYPKDQALVLSDYYKRQIDLSDATLDFDKFMKNTNKPYVFAYFGDHHGILGLKENDLLLPHKNPFFITGFYAKGSEEIQKLATTELSELGLNTSVLLELMQIKPNKYFEAIYAMRKLCAAVETCKDKNLTKSYKSYIYDYLKVASQNSNR